MKNAFEEALVEEVVRVKSNGTRRPELAAASIFTASNQEHFCQIRLCCFFQPVDFGRLPGMAGYMILGSYD